MELIIRNTTNQPIYDQIYAQIKAQIIAGKLAPGEALPSIRALAKDLRISVITTKRAYDELEADGFLYTVAGKGCFVAEKNLDLIREQKLKELEDHLDAAVELAAQCGVSPAELHGDAPYPAERGGTSRMNAIELSHVTKHFPGFTLQDLSLAVPSGTICGLVGENGAGKSTTIRLLMGGPAAGQRHLHRPGDGRRLAGVPRRERGHRRGAGRGLFPREPERPSGGGRHGQDLPPVGRQAVPELSHPLRPAGEEALQGLLPGHEDEAGHRRGPEPQPQAAGAGRGHLPAWTPSSGTRCWRSSTSSPGRRTTPS